MPFVATKLYRKILRRKIRYDARVERVQQLIRKSPRLVLAPIGLEIEVQPTEVLIDCGANVGDVASAMARTGARVYAYEPDSMCFSILSKRFSLTPNVVCLHQGVMDKNCWLTLRSPQAHENWDDLDSTVSSSFVRLDLPNARESKVECVDLSEIIKMLGKRVRLLKLDIEGAEIQVINGLIDSKAIDLIDLLVVETHEKQQPSLIRETDRLRQRIRQLGLDAKFRLDWV